MPRITRSEVERIAALARLELSGPEADRMTAELETILGFVETLSGLDTEGVEPTAHAMSLATPLRPDEPAEPLDPALAMSNAPEQDGFAFVVPKVLDEDEA